MPEIKGLWCWQAFRKWKYVVVLEVHAKVVVAVAVLTWSATPSFYVFQAYVRLPADLPSLDLGKFIYLPHPTISSQFCYRRSP